MGKKLLLCNLHGKHLLLLAVLVCCNFIAFSQSIPIVGTVVDSLDSKGIPNVSVQVNGTSIRTQADANGKYAITASADAILVFRSIGYQERRIAINGKTTINVRLSVTNEGLDEVVVVAYAQQKKETITGAIASVKTKEIKQSPAANLAVTLAGRLPGLTTIQTSGEPGRDATMLFIRGISTSNQTSPVVLVDGIERELTHIDPNEVESVSILKDASSTALFGVRGANGVILVTTKRGASEVPQINVSFEGAGQTFPRFIEPVNSYEFATLKNLALKNDGLAPAYSPEIVEKYRDGSDPARFPNTDWMKLLVKDVSFQKRYNMNLSGMSNNKAMNYFVNATYLNQGGQFNVEEDLDYDPSFKLDRYSFRSNIDLKLNKSLKAFMNVAGYLEKQNMPMGLLNQLGEINSQVAGSSPATYIISYAADLPANVPGPTTPAGDVTTAPNVGWPAYGLINRSGYIRQSRSNVLATFGMEQDLKIITEGLSVKVVASFDTRAINNLFGSRNFAKFVQVILPGIPGQDGLDSVYFNQLDLVENTPLAIGGGSSFVSLSNFQGYLNYSRAFGKHAVGGMVIYQQQQNIAGIALPFNLRGFAGRFTYGYASKYFAEFNAGYNGSEQFAKGRRFGFFPAISAGWLITNENFLKNNPVLTNLKLRGSYGFVGNDQLGGSRFLYLDDIYLTGGGYSSSLGRGQTIGINRLRNENITWERAEKTNLGLEVGLFGKLELTVDVFKERRENILRYRGTIPIINGFSSSVLPPANIGIIENHGYEIELNYREKVTQDWSFLAKLNFNYAKNNQIFVDEAKLGEKYKYRYRATGYSLGQPFGYIVDRYFTDAADVANSPVQVLGAHASRPGDFKYKDLNEDGVVDQFDMAPMGYSQIPQYTFGLALSTNYKQFDISFLFQGAANVSRFLSGTGVFPVTNYSKWHLESWTEERVANNEPIKYPRLTTQPSPNSIANDFFMANASYLRLKNMEIGYNLPMKALARIRIKQVRFYANGMNLITWDKMPIKTFDPELLAGTSYPIPRVYNVGFNVIF